MLRPHEEEKVWQAERSVSHPTAYGTLTFLCSHYGVDGLQLFTGFLMAFYLYTSK